MIKKLCIFDFDGTLFKSPGPGKHYKNSIDDWYRDPVSLSPPMVPSIPSDDWFFNDIVGLAKEAASCSETYTVLMTGRRGDLGNFHSRIRDIVCNKGMRFDEVYLKPRDMKTVEYKSDVIFQIAHQLEAENKGLDEVHIYDDRHHHLPVFEKKLRLSKAKVYTHPVGEHNTSG